MGHTIRFPTGHVVGRPAVVRSACKTLADRISSEHVHLEMYAGVILRPTPSPFALGTV
jgi:hypothetical protein